MKRRDTVRIHWPYVIAETFFVAYQLAWTALFLANGLLFAALGALYVGACVTGLAYFYGDHAGKVCFVIDRARRHKGRPTRLMQDSPVRYRAAMTRRADETRVGAREPSAPPHRI